MLAPQQLCSYETQAQKIVMLTAYDYASGSAVANSNVDVILVATAWVWSYWVL
jgi:ketopantoate hydroxymethyltransferase